MKLTWGAAVIAGYVLAVSGCSDDGGESSNSEAGKTVSSVESAPATDDDPVGCYPAPNLFVDAITKRLDEPSQSITNAFALQNGENLIYISAHIMEGGKRVSSADVWVVDNDFGSIYAVSDQAVSLTSMSDAPIDLGVDVGDQWGQQVQECVIQDSGR